MERCLRVLFFCDSSNDAALILQNLEHAGIQVSYEYIETPDQYKIALLEKSWDLILSQIKASRLDLYMALSVRNEIVPNIPFFVLDEEYSDKIALDLINGGASDYLSMDQISRLSLSIIRELKRPNLRKEIYAGENIENKGAEALLIQTNERLIRAALVSKAGNWEYDLETGIISSSEGAQKLYGVEGENWNYDEIKMIPLPEYRELLDKGLNALIHSGEPYDFEFKITQKNTGHIIDIHSIAEYDSAKRIVFGVIQDITERKKIEVALLRSEEKYRILIENQGEGVATVDLNEIFVFANPAADQMFGVPAGTLVNRCLLDFLDPYQVDKIKNQTALRAHMEKSSYEIEIVALTGEIHHLLVTATPQTDVQGKIIGTFGIFRDITERKKAESELVNSERKYRELANSLPVGIFEADLSGTITFANETLMNWLNYSEYEVITGINMIQFIPENERDTVVGQFAELIEKELQRAKEYTAIRKDGSSFPVLVSVCVIKSDGLVTGIRGTLTDITERKQIEEALNASDKLFSDLVEKMPDGVYKSTSEGKFISVNPAMVSMLGYSSKEELMAIDIKKELYFDPDERNQVILTTAAEGTDLFRLKKKDKSEIWVEDHGWFNFDEKKNILYHEGILRDVTGRKAVEDKLRILSQTVEQNPSSTIITDANGNIEYVNNAFSFLTQYTLDEVIHKPPRIFNPGHIKEADFALMWTTLSERRIWKGEYQNRRKDKSIYWEDVTISSLTNSKGVISNFILIMVDISEKKKMFDDMIRAKESAEESDRLKSAFLAMMNHELRTPLTHILGFSELIMSSVSTEDNISFATSIQSSGQNLLSIIEGVFDLALMDHSKIKLSNQTFSLMDHYMENKASFDHILRTSAKNEQINLIFKPDTHWLSSYLTADRGKINQVLTNLFKNAVKFTHEGTIEFGFTVENESVISFYIKDSGIGIPEEKQSVIFDYFRQVDDSYTRVYGGIGVGLAISKKIATILHGELKVISRPGEGSIFSLSLPVELSYIKD